jgi:hypothetical protein
MHIDLWEALAGGIVGFTVGLTGMGGGALMTPMLVLLFGINPGTAVSSDLLTSLVMKPIGGAVHFRRGTIEWSLVWWSVLGSVPAAFAGVFVLRALGHGSKVQNRISTLLGWALIVAAVSMVAKVFMSRRAEARAEARTDAAPADEPLVAKRVGTVLIGVVGGFIVGVTSVGSGSLMIVMLLLLYPRLSAKRLVGTDLIQAIPLVASATLGHALFGQIDLGVTASILVGGIPGVYFGARVSSRAPDSIIRPALIVILLGSALKLLGLGTSSVLWTIVVAVVVAVPLWGATDAAVRAAGEWGRAGYRRTVWVVAQSVGAPFGVGLAISIVYFWRVRPALKAAVEPRQLVST